MKYSFKFIVSLLVLLYIIVTILFYSFYKNLAIKDIKQEAISVLNTMNAIRCYIGNVQRPIIDNFKYTNKIDKDFFDPRLLSATFISNYIYNILIKKGKINYSYRLAATNPTNPANKATEFEVSILKRFQNKEIDTYFDVRKKDGEDYFYIAMPVEPNKPMCLECHGDPSIAPEGMKKIYGDKNGFYEKVGDIRALISLNIPAKDIIRTHFIQFVTGGLAMLVTFIIFIFLIYLITRKEQKLQQKKELLLKNQNKLATMGEMLNNIAHQWRQPLTQLSSILVNLQLQAQKGYLSNEKLNDKLEEASQQIIFMSQTIDSFRNFFIMEEEKKKYHISEIIQHANQLVGASLEENAIQLTIDIQSDFLLCVRRNEIIQVIINLINNAKDALIEQDRKNKKIVIKTLIKEEKNLILIEDNGGGIDPKIIDKIFEPYFTTKHPSMGTGIGLYMCKVIIEKKYGGHIDVENKEKGALFVIEFNSNKDIESLCKK